MSFPSHTGLAAGIRNSGGSGGAVGPVETLPILHYTMDNTSGGIAAELENENLLAMTVDMQPIIDKHYTDTLAMTVDMQPIVDKHYTETLAMSVYIVNGFWT